MSMEYEIKIRMWVKNDKYEEQFKKWKEQNRYNNGACDPQPQPTEAVKMLETRVNQEQFEAIRKAALECF